MPLLRHPLGFHAATSTIFALAHDALRGVITLGETAGSMDNSQRFQARIKRRINWRDFDPKGITDLIPENARAADIQFRLRLDGRNWRRGRIYPDFIFAVRADGAGGRIVVLEINDPHERVEDEAPELPGDEARRPDRHP